MKLNEFKLKAADGAEIHVNDSPRMSLRLLEKNVLQTKT
jgi:hypothetical protein